MKKLSSNAEKRTVLLFFIIFCIYILYCKSSTFYLVIKLVFIVFLKLWEFGGQRFNRSFFVQYLSNWPVSSLANLPQEQINRLLASLGSVRIAKSCDLGLQNAALDRRPCAAFSRPRSQVFTRRTITYIYLRTSWIRRSTWEKKESYKYIKPPWVRVLNRRGNKYSLI